MREGVCSAASVKIAGGACWSGAGGCFDVFLPRPFGERVGVRGRGLGCAAGRELAPAGELLFFARLRRSVQTTAASQITKRMHPAVHSPTPSAALLGASRVGWGTTRAIAALGPRSISAAASRGVDCLPLPRAGEGWGEGAVTPSPAGGRQGWGPAPWPMDMSLAPTPTLPQRGRGQVTLTPALSRPRERGQKTRAERSDGPNGLQRPSGRAEKRRAWGGPGSAACRASCSDSLRLSERRERSEQSEFRSAAPCPSIAGCPKGHGQRGRLSFAYFSLAKQRKVGRPPGRIPGQQRIQRPRPSPQPSPQRGEGGIPLGSGS